MNVLKSLKDKINKKGNWGIINLLIVVGEIRHNINCITEINYKPYGVRRVQFNQLGRILKNIITVDIVVNVFQTVLTEKFGVDHNSKQQVEI